MLHDAQRAFGSRNWPEAFERLSTSDVRQPLEADDLERLATAAYLSGHDQASSEAWTRAYRARLDRGEPEQALRCTFWLAFGLLQRGEAAHAGGWLGRARRLVEERDLDCVGCGYLLVPDGLMAMYGGDPVTAAARFAEVAAIARRFDDPDLGALGTLGQGQVLLRTGGAARGLQLFDEAMVAVTAGEVSATVSGIVYCAVIDECQQMFDVSRAREWTAALSRWCDAQPGLVPYRGQCLVHRSEVLQLQGAWPEALAEVQQACELLADPPHPAIGMAYYQLAELHRARGDLGEAEEAYRRAHELGRQPQPGLALLRLQQGRTEAAAAAIERAVGEGQGGVNRAKLLAAHVAIMLAADRPDDADGAVAELTALADDVGAMALRALAAQGRGAVQLASGDPAGALGPLREASRTWQEVDAPLEAAETRVLIALACRALDDHDTAALECAPARDAFDRLGAGPASARLRELFPEFRPSSDAAPVTERELQVLRLVALGRTNREVATALVLSEKTVERHLSNIFTKLGVANRVAATAYAYDHRLL